MNLDCLGCKYFRSFRDDYNDSMESDDQGFCTKEESKYHGNEGAGVGIVCDHHEFIPVSVLKVEPMVYNSKKAIFRFVEKIR